MFSALIPAFFFRIIFCSFVFIAAVVPVYSQDAEGTPQGNPLKKCWTYGLDSTEVRALFADESLIYAATSDGKLRSLSAQDGTAVWTVELGGEFASKILGVNEDLIVVSNTSGEKKQSVIRAIRKQTGVARWRAEVPFSEKYYLGSSDPNGIAAIGSAGFALGISSESGATVWKTDLAAVAAEPSFKNGLVLIGAGSTRIYLLSLAERGRIVLNIESRWKPKAVAILDHGRFVAGDERGNITAFHSQGSRDWKFKNGASISHLTQTDEGILAASNDNFIYMLTENRGGVVWKRRLSGRIALEPVLMRDSIFVATYGDGRGYLINLDEGKIVDQTSDSNKE
ncbi:MAG TPA: PQQ-binding-like beta-propeller repeat protein, partial [Pyrinomonadaceae bacterium]|nr:PQQ-binding-like beta-propeller repeat protein [Pyrinomonadaceae bacterium]